MLDLSRTRGSTAFNYLMFDDHGKAVGFCHKVDLHEHWRALRVKQRSHCTFEVRDIVGLPRPCPS